MAKRRDWFKGESFFGADDTEEFINSNYRRDDGMVYYPCSIEPRQAVKVNFFDGNEPHKGFVRSVKFTPSKVWFDVAVKGRGDYRTAMEVNSVCVSPLDDKDRQFYFQSPYALGEPVLVEFPNTTVVPAQIDAVVFGVENVWYDVWMGTGDERIVLHGISDDLIRGR